MIDPFGQSSINWEDVKKREIGLKAKNLIYLFLNGFKRYIPQFIVIEPEEIEKIYGGETADFRKWNGNIYDKAEKFRSKQLFIRSSINIEDKKGIPTAGLFKSIGNVSFSNIPESIWNIINHAKSREVGRILKTNIKISVLLQEMIFPKVSGVVFTFNPITGSKNDILIESAWGLGETVVSGRYNIDRYRIKRNSIKNELITQKENTNSNIYSPIIERTIEFKTSYICPNSGKEESLSDEMANKSSLLDEEIIMIVNLALKIENIMKEPVDIEWAIDEENNLFILQCRSAQ